MEVRGISDAEPQEAELEPVQSLQQEPEQEAEQPLKRMSRRSRKAGVEGGKRKHQGRRGYGRARSGWQLSRSVVNPSVQCPLAIPFVLCLWLVCCVCRGATFNLFCNQSTIAKLCMLVGQWPYGQYHLVILRNQWSPSYYAINWLGSLAGGHWSWWFSALPSSLRGLISIGLCVCCVW